METCSRISDMWKCDKCNRNGICSVCRHYVNGGDPAVRKVAAVYPEEWTNKDDGRAGVQAEEIAACTLAGQKTHKLSLKAYDEGYDIYVLRMECKSSRFTLTHKELGYEKGDMIRYYFATAKAKRYCYVDRDHDIVYEMNKRAFEELLYMMCDVEMKKTCKVLRMRPQTNYMIRWLDWVAQQREYVR